MKVFIQTYGCQANIADSEVIAGLLKKHKHILVNSEKEADLILINSCSVKNSTQSKILDYIKKYIKTKKITVGGCLTKTLDLRKKYPQIQSLFDTNSILKVPELIKNSKDHFSDKKESRLSSPLIRKDKEIGIITIGEGCISHCTFCATKLARGNLKSYRIGDIKRSFEKAIQEGCKKIYLTSQDTGCYGFDIKTSSPELLNTLIEIEGDHIIRVGMMNPWHLTKILPELLNSYSSSKIMKFIHIPVQSGSEKVLKDMKRIHTVNNFKTTIKEFRKSYPKITIATDIIVGYPTETEEDFKLTYNLIKELKPKVLNISKFSSRPNTEASKLSQLPSETINERSKEISKLYQKYRLDIT